MNRADVIAHTRDLAAQLDDSEDVALCPVPRGLPAGKRAEVLDLLTASVAELRKSRPDVRARTIAGERLGRGDICELLFVVWTGERPAFFDEDAGAR